MRALEKRTTHTLIAIAAVLLAPAIVVAPLHAQAAPEDRPVVGVAFGGGSALGLAHVGVIRWFEEHRIPIDVVAGTSMGGLVGGAFASGMSSNELRRFLATIDWAELFAGSSYRLKSIPRKQDAREFPSKLEFHVRRRVKLPNALNNGQQVDLLLEGLAAPYAGLTTFDSLPTPLRTVTVDVRTAERVVLDRGSLALALRSTMSLPGIFPPVEDGERLFVDGGVMDNVPADVVREMGADVVIAVNVGRLPGTREVSDAGLFGVVSSTVDALVRASTRRGLAAADVVINPTLEQFDRFDFPDGDSLAAGGYAAAEAMKTALLPLAVDERTWRQYLAQRAARRRTVIPVVGALAMEGVTPADERLLARRLSWQVGRRLDVERMKHELVRFAASDRYRTVSWELHPEADRFKLVVRARLNENAPPLAMFAMNVRSLTSHDYSFQLAARYLMFDAFVPGAELRADVALGSSPRLATAWRRPIGDAGLFAALGAGAAQQRRSLSFEDRIVAQYDQRQLMANVGIGMTFGVTSELRADLRGGRTVIRPRVGDSGLPSVSGPDAEVGLRWLYDTQTNYIAPTSGLRLLATVRQVLAWPDPPRSSGIEATNDGLVQSEVQGSRFWGIKGDRDRVFVTGGAGTSFGFHPLATEQFELGLPFRLDGFSLAERRGDHYGVLSGGYLRGVSRLPQFLGDRLFVGSWLETGSAFDTQSSTVLEAQVGVGMLVETLVGPAFLGATIGTHGARRVNVSFGKLFP